LSGQRGGHVLRVQGLGKLFYENLQAVTW